MKRIIFLLFAFAPILVSAQSITADPALDPMKITNLTNGIILVNQLPINGLIKLKVPILNKNLSNALPAGTCKIKIGLGSKIILNPLFNLTTVNTSAYFHWTAQILGGQMQIIGDLIAELPANFSDTAYFDVKGTILGSSTITTNFLVTNHNAGTYLSDENGANNTAFTSYTIVNTIVPVTFTNIVTEKNKCNLKVIFDIENEINVDRYELEVSNNFTNFEKISSTKAHNIKQYAFDFNVPTQYQVDKLVYRIKAIDLDGTIRYSEIKKTSGMCGFEDIVSIYPNPVTNNTDNIYIKNKASLFNGIYYITTLDVTGKILNTKEIAPVNTTEIIYNIKALPVGKYIIKLIKKGNTIDVLSFKIIKL